VLQRGARLGLPVLVTYDGSSISRRALVAATQFSQTRDGELAVMILADDAAMAQRLQSQVTQWLRERELHAQFIQLTEVNAQTLAQLVEQEACRVLVLPTPSLGLSEEAVRHVLEGLDCPVLLVH
jgi:nucleotide-binding universal stress UspA family protein